MKKFDIKDVFSWSNAEQAKAYIGKYCYFADSLQYLKRQVNQDITFKLKSVFNIDSYPVQGVFCDIDNDFWGLCLPADKVKEVKEPKKWRAFKTIEEFFDIYNKNIGSLITYRIKANPLREVTTSIMGYIKEANIEDQLQLGVATLKLSAWHEVMEIWNEDEESWQPFGVLEE